MPKDQAKSEAACVADTAAHGIGHNRPPKSAVQVMFEMVGKRAKRIELPFECKAPWVRWTNAVELKRLAKLQVRADLARQRMREAEAEQRRIRNRCIRRMRRASGKN